MIVNTMSVYDARELKDAINNQVLENESFKK